jgi:outer membrane receptor protein involved in Fe transport
MKSRVRIAVAGVLLAVWGIGILPAAERGAVRGIVRDRDGNPLPGATVVLTRPGTGFAERGTLTSETGEFLLAELPPGAGYQLTIRLPGYQTISFSDLEIRAGETVQEAVTLYPGLTQRVRVTGQPDTIRSESATTQTTISGEFLAGLPVLGRDYQDILTLAPGVTDVNQTGNPNIHGARDTDVVTLVDGVNTTDPFTGHYGQELNIESIAEIEVITAGAPAEFGRAGGGFVTILTKSGGNEFEGSFKLFVRSRWLDGDGAGIDDPELRSGLGEARGFRDLEFTDLYPFLSVSGPIRVDRAWYYFAPEYVQIEEPVNAGTYAYVAHTRSTRATSKLTWQAAPSRKLTFTALFDRTREEDQGLTSRTDPESAYAFDRGGPTLTARWTSVPRPNLSLETTFSRFDQSFGVVPALDADTNRNGLLFTDALASLGGNADGFVSARERDPGEDFDRDGRYDVFEDFNHNRKLDACVFDERTGETVCLDDRDRDGRLTGMNGCEGREREDWNCNGRIDLEQDANMNGVADPEEDQGIPCANYLICPQGVVPGTRGNGRFDTEDRDGSGMLDVTPGGGDTPFPHWSDRDGDGFPDRGEFRSPEPPDRDYVRDLSTDRLSGPFWFDYRDERRRGTFREDLSFFRDDLLGSHDAKIGILFEREGFDRTRDQRGYFEIQPGGINPSTGQIGGTVGTLIPTRTRTRNAADGDHFGFYFQDTYKPLPNLALGLGLRFDREEVRSDGYEFFDPIRQREEFDVLMNLRGVEEGQNDLNADGILTYSLAADPLYGPNAHRVLLLASDLARLAVSRFTRHDFTTSIESARLAELGIEDPLLLQNGRPRQPEEFRITNHNLAPRLSLTWDPLSDGKSKVFASWGRFYGNLFLQTVVGEQGPDQLARYYAYDADGVDALGFPNNRAGARISAPPPSAFQVDRGMRTPFTDEFSAGVAREIAPEVSVSFTAVRRRFRDQLQDIDVNHSTRRPPFCKRTVTPGGFCDDFGRVEVPPPATGPRNTAQDEWHSDSYPDLYIHNPNFNQIYRVGNTNYQDYASYEIQLVRRLKRRWQLDASYVFSRARGQAESFLSESGDDPAITELKDGYLDYDQRHVAKFHAVAYLPGDWQIGGGLTWASGLPFSFINRFGSHDNLQFRQIRRLFGRSDPATGLFLEEERNAHRSPATYDVNVRTQRNFVLGKAAAGAFFEVFNLLNRDDIRVYEIDNHFRFDQTDSVRRFGRRFQVGIQLTF